VGYVARNVLMRTECLVFVRNGLGDLDVKGGGEGMWR
jgi:hypothetical protein